MVQSTRINRTFEDFRNTPCCKYYLICELTYSIRREEYLSFNGFTYSSTHPLINIGGMDMRSMPLFAHKTHTNTHSVLFVYFCCSFTMYFLWKQDRMWVNTSMPFVYWYVLLCFFKRQNILGFYCISVLIAGHLYALKKFSKYS